MKKEQLSVVFILLSAIPLVLAVVGAFGYDLWLASTQWLLVTITLSVYGIYTRMR